MLIVLQGFNQLDRASLMKRIEGDLSIPQVSLPINLTVEELAVQLPAHGVVHTNFWARPKTIREEGRWLEMLLDSRGAVTLTSAVPPTYQITPGFEVPDDFDGLNLSQVYALARNRDRLAARSLYARSAGYIGSLEPSVVLVGDQPNRPNTPKGELPFLPRALGCGRYLLAAMESILTRGFRVGIVNSRMADGLARNLTWLVNGPSVGPAVIALGGTASEVLADQGIPHAYVPHPAYVKSHHYQQDRYATMLGAATSGRYDLDLRRELRR